MGCDVDHVLYLLGYSVSIHAPAWGATPYMAVKEIKKWFQSTHPRGVRRGQTCATVSNGSFNPRTRVGCDQVLGSLWGLVLCFNPRTRVGCDMLHKLLTMFLSRVSIHAPAWGATPNLAKTKAKSVSFNPRTRVGCDGTTAISSMALSAVSIHAPAWVRPLIMLRYFVSVQ